MKKGTKIALCVSAALIAAGIIMTGIGALAGGYEQLDQVNAGFKHSMVRHWRLPWSYSMYSLPGLGTLVDALESHEDWEAHHSEDDWEVHHIDDVDDIDDLDDGGGWGLFGTYNGEKQEAGQEVYSGDFEIDLDEIGKLHSLEVEIGIHSVEIEEGDVSGIHISGTGCDKVQVYVKNGTLHVKDVGKKKIPKNGSLNGKNRNISVTVPSGTEWKEAELSADMGSVSVDVLRCSEAEMDADMGSIEVGSAAVGELEVDADMGSVVMDDAQIGRLKMEASMGSIVISGVVEGNVKAETDMGSIRLILGQKEEDFNYRISADMGSVTIDGRDYSGLSKEKEIRNDADKKMELDSSMGNIEILFE